MHGAEIDLPVPDPLPSGEGELWGLIEVSIHRMSGAVETEGRAEQTWVTNGGDGEEPRNEVLAW